MTDISRFRGCLLGGAAGDALGYPVEFMGESAIFARYGRQGICDYALTGGEALISDDTQMTLFTATGLLTGAVRGRGQVDIGCVWASYQDWLRTQWGPAMGPGETRNSWLTGLPALWSARAPGNTCISALGGSPGSMDAPHNASPGCGGVMRVAPVGLFLPTLAGVTQDETDLFGARAAALTHGSDLAYMPAAMLVHMVSVLAHGEDTDPSAAAEDALTAVKRLFAGRPHIDRFAALMERAMDLAGSGTEELQAIHSLGEGWHGDEALAIAVYCALKYSDDIERALIAAVNHRGDSDSTGAIAGNILGAYLGLDAIPEKFIRQLELKDVILEVADDLFRGADMVSGTGADDAWRAKYADMTYGRKFMRHNG